MKVEFPRQIFETTQKSNFTKIRVGAELVQAYGQTDMTKLAVAFCFFFPIASRNGTMYAIFDQWNCCFFGNGAVGPRWHIWQSCIYLVSVALPPILAHILFLSTCKLIINYIYCKRNAELFETTFFLWFDYITFGRDSLSVRFFYLNFLPLLLFI